MPEKEGHIETRLATPDDLHRLAAQTGTSDSGLLRVIQTVKATKKPPKQTPR